MNTIPNLDCETTEALQNFWFRYSRASRKAAAELIGDKRKSYTRFAQDLANYASNKAAVQTCRERGDIQAAQVYEIICERIYEGLPDDLCW